MSLVTEELVEPTRQSVQPFVSHNVKILMAFCGVDQAGIGRVIGKTDKAVGHKLAGRASWTADEIAALSVFGGDKWPLARFFNDPTGRAVTLAKPRRELRSIPGEGRDPRPRTPLVSVVTSEV